MFRCKKSLFVFLLPGLLGVMIFYIIPFIGGIGYSLTDGRAALKIIGFANYTNVWNNPIFQLAFKNTILLSFLCAPIVWILSYLLALLISQEHADHLALHNAIFLPYVVPTSSILLIWLLLFDFSGPINHFLTLVGGEHIFFFSGSAMYFPIVLLFIWKNVGLATIIFSCAIRAIPDSLFEYATLEGANMFDKNIHITFPHILPTCFLVLTLAWINALKIFKEVFLLGGAYPDPAVYTLQHYMNNMYNKLNYPYASAAAYSLTVAVFAFFSILFLIQKMCVRKMEGEA